MTISIEDQVSAFERIEAGAPWAEQLAAVTRAVDAEQARCEAALFPVELKPSTADAFAAYGFHISRLGAARYGERLAAEVHHRAVVSFPDLAALCRTPEALDDVATAAASLVRSGTDQEPVAAAQARAATAARADYMREVARHLAGVPGHELGDAARGFLGCGSARQRVAVESRRYEAAARAELEAAAEAQREADRLVIDRTAEIVREKAAAVQRARATAAELERVYRSARADELIAKLRALRTDSIRAAGGVYGVADAIANAHGFSLEQLDQYEAAIRDAR